ncbi:hypothetical protein IAU60_004392 [Kwoniella sp. DSM 27419]
MTDDSPRPFSTTSSIITPHVALEGLERLASESHLGHEASSSSSYHPHRAGEGSGQPDVDSLNTDNNGDGFDADDHAGLEGEPEGDTPYLVRARFAFTATDDSALSFAAGDVIQVFSKLESGWWDGGLYGKRGWFPSNYVEDVGEEDIKRWSAGEGSRQEGTAYGDDEPIPHHESTGQDELRMDDVLSAGWGVWGSGGDLDQLARDMMNGEDDDEDGRGFADEARRRRALADGVLLSEPDEFGLANDRRREETDATIRPSTSGANPLAYRSGTIASDPVGHPQAGPQDAWIPKITPDGQVYYHNVQTGEDSWELPLEGLDGGEDSGLGYQLHDDNDFFRTMPSDMPPGSGRSPTQSTYTYDEDRDFRPPSAVQNSIPYPWIAKLSDDGRQYYYYNRLTGQSRSDLPITKGDATSMTEVGMGMNRLSVGSRSTPPRRASVELQRKAVDEWERKTAEALRAVICPPDQPTMAALMDDVNDCLRGIFEAAVAGSAAEEEMSRAADLGSESGMIVAVLREESASESLAAAHRATLAAIRRLLVAFGYVGPLDRMDEMPRPPWVGDMTLLGTIGLLSAHTHAAVVSKRLPDSGMSLWAEVMRSASKVRDVIANFPNNALAGQVLPNGVDSAEGRRLEAWLGYDVIGEPLGGRWGFGPSGSGLRKLDQAAVVEVQAVKTQFDSLMRDPLRADPVDLIRFASKMRELVGHIDIASVIDIDVNDGVLGRGARAREDDLEEYNHLVEQSRQAIRDLDESLRLVQTASIHLLSRVTPVEIQPAAESLAGAVGTAFRALPTLLIIAGEQAAAVDQGLIRGQIGRQCRMKQASRSGSSRHSVVSTNSRRSGTTTDASLRRSRVQGLEEESNVMDDFAESRDQAGQMPLGSASASTSSLPRGQGTSQSQGHGHGHGHGHAGHQHSRASSTTSLAYQPTESDSGSQKGNRSSILRAFRRNRSDSDADGAKNSRRTPSKKLAKLLGEDVSSIPISASVPPPPPPETPWYLLDDFESGEIIFDEKGGVKAGTLKALVIRLTQHSSTDTPFFQAFLLTFRSFTNAHELFEHLVERYNIAEPVNLTAEQSHEWRVKKQAPIRLRVANALRTWLERHYIEQTDYEVLPRIEQFASTTLLANGSELMSKQLLTLVGKRRQGEPEHGRGGASGSLLSPPPSLLPRTTGRQLRLTDVAPLEIARQLTIVEFVHFQRIKPSECLNRAWADEHAGSINAPNVRNVILTANRMAGWVALHILSSKDVRQRATAMKILIQVAVECRNLNNFSSMAGIVAGLNSAPITRLKRTKELLSAKTQSMKADLDMTLDSTKNFANYRDMLKTINPPCVPFFGFYLSALTFIEDGNKNDIQAGAPVRGLSTSNSSSSLSAGLRPLPSSTSASTLHSAATAQGVAGGQDGATPIVTPTQPLINFFKRGLNAEILRDIAQYQSQPYNLAKCRPVLDWIMRGLDEVEKGGDLYEISQALEPREKEEERITRMLQDSGFI